MRFRFATRVAGLGVAAGRAQCVVTDDGHVDCDAVVLAAGVESAAIASQFGIDLRLYPNLNVGHGSTGWAMACGSARVVADLVVDRVPGIDLEGLTLQRFAA